MTERDTQRLELSLEVFGIHFFAGSERIHIHWSRGFGPRLQILSIHIETRRRLDNGDHMEWKTTGLSIDTESFRYAAVYAHRYKG
jgi:hypothetical protein